MHGQAVEQDVLLRCGAGQEHVTRARGESPLDELTREARDPRFAVDARACLREPLERVAGAKAQAHVLKQREGLVDDEAPFVAAGPAHPGPHAASRRSSPPRPTAASRGAATVASPAPCAMSLREPPRRPRLLLHREARLAHRRLGVAGEIGGEGLDLVGTRSEGA